VKRQDTLLKITEKLDIIKQEMDERGSSMTDGSMYWIYNFVLFKFII